MSEVKNPVIGIAKDRWTDDVNNTLESGLYSVASSGGGDPFDAQDVISIRRSDKYGDQMSFDETSAIPSCRFRRLVGGNYSGWYGLVQCTDNTNQIIDINNRNIPTGIYSCNSGSYSIPNNNPVPFSAYELLVIKRSANNIYQVAFGEDGVMSVKVRNYGGGRWTPWYAVGLTAVSGDQPMPGPEIMDYATDADTAAQASSRGGYNARYVVSVLPALMGRWAA